jgi:hypothetical protein
MYNFTPPYFQGNAFNCPHCNAYSHQKWEAIPTQQIEKIYISYCECCWQCTIWYRGKMIFPDISPAPPPNGDLPEEIKEIYNEARSIVNRSPRGAAALLRLAVQKLCMYLRESGKNLNDCIANLVKKGLPDKIQKALDTVRVIGNNAVHPGQIDLNDNPELAYRLFELINLIAEWGITQPKKVEELYSKLPDSQKEAIKKRDEKNKSEDEE